MSRIKTFSALLLVLCVFLSLLTSCSNITASETTAGDTSDTSTETTTAPETTARELHEPNVRQLCGLFCYYNQTDVHYYFDPLKYGDSIPHIINSVEEFERFLICFDFSQNNVIPIIDSVSYGFELIPGDTNECYINKTSFTAIYDERFFNDRILAVIWNDTDITACHRILTAIYINDGRVMTFMPAIVSKSSSPSLMTSNKLVKFIELDRLLLDEKIVLSTDDNSVKDMKYEWNILSRKCETDEESYALLLETYGDTFYYIEPWVLKPES